MTLIARFMFESMPLYIGDLLLSGERKPSARVDIPAALDINAKLPLNALRSITGLRQKLNILGEGLIVAWSGQMLQARHLLPQIAKAVAEGANWQDVNGLLESLPIKDRNDVALIGTIVRPVTKPRAGFHIQNFGYSFFKRHFNGIEISAAGSGMDALFELVPQVLVHESITNEENIYGRALKSGMMASAALVGHETSTGQNLLSWWGGAIEFAVLERAVDFEKSIRFSIQFGERANSPTAATKLVWCQSSSSTTTSKTC